MAKKIIRLTEADLEKIVRKVIAEQKTINVIATQGSSPEATLSLENGKKMLTVKYESGLTPDQKFEIKTDFPITKTQKVFVVYNGKNVFLIGKNKVPATIVSQIK